MARCASAAFLPEGYEGNDDLFGKNWDGRTFYTQKIDCAMGTDGEVYRCGQIREPSVTSGIGANYGNSMILYGTDPVVVEYDPGTDIVIEKFSFLPVSDDFFQGNQNSYIRPFSGETSFYNEKTGSYDPVDIRKQDFSREELADYIAADGKITVRYTAGSDAETGVSQTLPLLMVTGKGKLMLKIQGLEKKFGKFEALSGLDMEVEEGRSMALSDRTEPERPRRSALSRDS